MDYDNVETMKDQITSVIDKLDSLRNRLDSSGNVPGKQDRDLLKMIMISEELPTIFRNMHLAIMTEDHDMGSDACYYFSKMMEKITGQKI